MARLKIKPDHRGIAALLKSSEMESAVKEATEAVAENVRAMGIRVGDRDGGPHETDLPVTTLMVTTDRAHGIVALAHASGDAVQAKYGALTKAAAEAGLDVSGP